MNRRHFCLSWGRKIFFGLSWPVSMALALIFLQSHLMPQGIASWTYFLSALIGYTGLITAAAYFLAFTPVITLFPTYYFSRFWSLILVLLINGLILVDAIVFAQFRFHLNELILHSLATEGVTGVFGGMSPLWLVGVSLFVLGLTVWLRGERVWRFMQKHFSNPVANWYLFVIAGLLGLAHVLAMSENFQHFRRGQSLASLFPLNYHELLQPKDATPTTGKVSFQYPLKPIKCGGASKPNILFLVAEGWTRENFSEEKTPFLYHLPDHATLFESHHFLAQSADEGIFSLLYGLPAVHAIETRNVIPAILAETKLRGYKHVFHSDRELLQSFGEKLPAAGTLVESWTAWNIDETPVMGFIEFKGQDPVALDQELRLFLNHLHNEGSLKESLLVVTGTHSRPGSGLPFFVVWPNRRKGEWSHFTTHYDVAATLMQELWSCKHAFTASEGKSLFLAPEQDWEIFGTEERFLVHRPSTGKSFSANLDGELSGEVGPEERRLYFKLLKEILKYQRRG